MKKLCTLIVAGLLFTASGMQLMAQCPTGQTEIEISVTTDDYGWEIFWELEENGVVVASGGNTAVVPGSQQWTTDPMLPGQYGNFQTYTSSVCVNSNSQIDFTISDDWGDGLAGDGGYSITIGGCEYNVVDAHVFVTETVANSLPLPDHDVAIESLNFDGQIGEKACLTGTISNLGSNTLTSFDLTWQIDNGATITRTFDGITVPCGETFDFSNGQPVDLTLGTTVPISVTVDNPNGAADEVSGNNSQTVNSFVNRGRYFKKQVLVEEFSGAWCQFCPDGAFILEQILDEYPEGSVGVTIHDGDAMEFPDGATIVSAFNSGFPSGAIDRVMYPGETDVAINRGQWSTRVTERQGNVPIGIEFSSSFDATSRILTVDVDAKIVDDVEPADYRVSVFVLEDKVTGTGSGYNQVNAYNGVQGHPYYQAGNPIVGFEHNKTLRAILNSSVNVWGDNGVIPGTGALGTYSKTYNYTVPASYDESEMFVVAFITKYNSVTSQEVLNAVKGGKNFISAIADEIVEDCPKTFFPSSVETLVDETAFEVFPNPVSDKVYINVMFGEATDVTIDLYDNLGQLVVTSGTMRSNAGSNRYFVNTGVLSNGMYHLVMRTLNGEMVTKEIVVAK